MDHNGFDPQTQHFLATIKSTRQTQLDVLRGVIEQFFPLSFHLFRGFLKVKPKLVNLNFSTHILHTVLLTFHVLLSKGVCLTILSCPREHQAVVLRTTVILLPPYN